MTQNPYVHAAKALFAGLAGATEARDDGSTQVGAAVCQAFADAADAFVNIESDGLPKLREQVHREIRIRRGRLIYLGKRVEPLGVRVQGDTFLHESVSELEAESARLYQLEVLLPFLDREALLVVLGATTTWDGRSDYMDIPRVLFPEPEPAAANESGCDDCNDTGCERCERAA